MEQVQPESPTRYLLPDQSLEEKSTCVIDYNSPATYPISTKKRKRLVKKEKAEKKPKTNMIRQECEGKTFHEAPRLQKMGKGWKSKSWRKERSLTLMFFWTSSHSNGILHHLVLLKPLQNPLGICHHRPAEAQRSCTLVLCIRTILYKRKRPTLSTAIRGTTNALSEIVLSAVEWTMSSIT